MKMAEILTRLRTSSASSYMCQGCDDGIKEEAADLIEVLLDAAREGLICAEADIEAQKALCEEWGDDPATDSVMAVFVKRRDLIAAAIAKASAQ